MNPFRTMTATLGPLGKKVYDKLQKELTPATLQVIDESPDHRGHAGVSDCSGPETHFRVLVESKQFEGKTILERHRKIYAILHDEMQPGGIHALAIEKASIPA